MLKQTIKQLTLGLVIIGLSACGGASGDSIDLPDSSSASAASAASTVFGSSEGGAGLVVSQASLRASIQAAMLSGDELESSFENDDAYTCDSVEDGTGPDDVIIDYNAEAGTYGSDNNSETLEEGDFCKDSDGNPTGVAEPFASFELTGDIPITCTDEGEEDILMLAGSSGVWQNLEGSDEDGPAGTYILGSFQYSVDGEELNFDCTIVIDEDENIEIADCTDEAGDVVVQETDSSCTIQSE